MVIMPQKYNLFYKNKYFIVLGVLIIVSKNVTGWQIIFLFYFKKYSNICVPYFLDKIKNRRLFWLQM
jgi:hypothetical protein